MIFWRCPERTLPKITKKYVARDCHNLEIMTSLFNKISGPEIKNTTR